MHMTQEEIREFERMLNHKHLLDDTFRCWWATRVKGASASMACDGNISIELLNAFDRIVMSMISAQ